MDDISLVPGLHLPNDNNEYSMLLASLKQMGYSRKYVNSPYNNVLLQCTVYIHTIVQSWKLAEQSTLTEAPF